MHQLIVTTKKDKTYCGFLVRFRPEFGWLEMNDNETGDVIRFEFKTLKSAIEEGQRVTINEIRDVDLIDKARQMGWKEEGS